MEHVTKCYIPIDRVTGAQARDLNTYKNIA